MEMSKTEFASHIGVSGARISQMINEHLIGPDALIGEGRNARINVEVAKAQIGTRRHVGQSLGNGLLTRLEDGPKPLSLVKPKDYDTAALIQLERLDQERRKNRQAERDEAIANGQLVPGDELQRQVAKASQAVVNTFAGMAPDIANAIAAKFELPQRDVLHLVRQVMRDKRQAAAAALKARGEALPATVESVLA